MRFRYWTAVGLGSTIALATMCARAQDLESSAPQLALGEAKAGYVQFAPFDKTAKRPYREYEDPRVYQINREPPRATLFNYESVERARRGDEAASDRYLSLDGDWKFHFSRNPGARPADFWRSGYDVSAWKSVKLPGMMERQGYDRPYYVNMSYVFPMNQPYVPEDFNPVGSYVRDIDVPAAWRGNDVFLRFGAAESAIYVWVNGRKVGYSESSKDPAEFNITRYLKPGRNRVAVELYRFSDGAYLEDMDMWRMSGFARSIDVYAVPAVRVGDYFAKAGLSADGRDGVLDVAVDLDAAAAARGRYTVEAELFAGDRSVLRQSQAVTVAPGRRTTASLKGVVPSVAAWTAETPSLYRMMLTVKDGAGRVVAAVPGHVGFRTVAVEGNRLMVNGKPVYLRGVNLHEHDADTGKVVSKETLEQDIRMMKALNMNALRTSHYPHRPYLYELADRYGMYVVDEANIESHGYMTKGTRAKDEKNVHLGYLPEWKDAHLARMKSLVERDKNHPSIIIWSLGNEAGAGPTFQALYDWAKARDTTRPVQYQAAGLKPPYTDLIVPFYPTVAMIDRWAAQHPDTPIIMSEYAHAMGNSVGNLADLWDAIYRHPNTQGGFIWDWVDQGLATKDSQGRSYFGYSGDFGPIARANIPGVNNERPNGASDGLLTSDRKYQPEAYEVRKVYQPARFALKDASAGTVEIRNLYDFNMLDRFDLAWEIAEDGVVRWRGKAAAPAIAPHATGTATLGLPSVPRAGGREYLLTVKLLARDGSAPTLADGTTIAWEQFDFAGPAAPPASATGVAKAVEGSDAVTVDAGRGITAVIDRASGQLTRFGAGSTNLIARAPSPNFWRPQTDNDYGWRVGERLAVWREATDTRGPATVRTTRTAAGGVEVTATMRVGKDTADVAIRYAFPGDGSVDVTTEMTPVAAELPVLPRFGLTMRMDDVYDRIEWYGRGPYESYPDRKTGAAVGRYSGSVWDQFHPYLRPQETGNKTDLRWMAITDRTGAGLLISGAPLFSGAALQLDPRDLDYDAVNNKHGALVRPADFVTVTMDGAMMGVGGDDSWGKRPMAKYMVEAKPMRFTVRLRALKAGDDPATVAR